MFEAGMLKRWRFRANDQTTDLAGLGLSPLVIKLLGNRGVTDPQQVRDFLNPKMTLVQKIEIGFPF